MPHIIRETDITVDLIWWGEATGAYAIREGVRHIETIRGYRAALQRRTDIIDERAGSARVGDIVRIGQGQAQYRVDGFDDTMRAVLYPTEVLSPAQSRVRRVECERLHAVRAER